MYTNINLENVQYFSSDGCPVLDKKLKPRPTVAMLQESGDDKLEEDELELDLSERVCRTGEGEVVGEEVWEEEGNETTGDKEYQHHTHTEHHLVLMKEGERERE